MRIARSAAGAERREVVAAGDELHAQAGILGEDRPARPPTRGAADRGGPSAGDCRPAPTPRRWPSGSRCSWPRRGPPNPAFVTTRPVSRIGARPLEDDPAVEPGEVLGVREPGVDRRHPPGARCAARVWNAARWASRVPSSMIELSAMNARRVAAGPGQAEVDTGPPRPRSMRPFPTRRRRGLAREPVRASPGRCRPR